MPKDSDLQVQARSGGVDRRRASNFAARVGRELTSAADLLARLNRGKPGPTRPSAPALARSWDVESLAATIANSAAKFLGSEQLDPDADFFDRGGTSANAVELLSQLSRELGVQISLDDLFADARPRRLAERFVGKAGNMLAAVASQPGVIAPEPSAVRAVVTSERRAPLPLPEPGGERSANVQDDLRALLQHIGDNARDYDGYAYVFYGPLYGPRADYSADYTLEGAGIAGQDVDVLDFDGDGGLDLLVGAPDVEMYGAAFVVPNTSL